MYLRNAWYVACTATDIDAGKLLGRTICGERVVLFRGEGGGACALEDFCPHRGAPAFARRPARRRPHRLRLPRPGDGRRRPVREHAGAARQADDPLVSGARALRLRLDLAGRQGQGRPAKLHPLPWAESPEWAYAGGLYHVHCDYRLMIDNLMDLTHETYVHAGSIGQPEIEEAAPVTRVEGDSAITSRFMHDIPAPPFWRAALRGNHLADDVPVDRWQICRFTPPSHVMIEVGVAHAGHGGYDARRRRRSRASSSTSSRPETDTSIWYFWGMARNFNVEDEALTATIRDGQAAIFARTSPSSSRSSAISPSSRSRHLMRLNIDMGGFESRRILERLVAEERNDLLATRLSEPSGTELRRGHADRLPHCLTTNRVPEARLADAPTCGQCKQELLARRRSRSTTPASRR
jgi:vanillate O-demethylase monooxygenase subunit